MPPAILYFAHRPGIGVSFPAFRWYTAVALLLFTFILLHELGHALMARNRGVKAEKIILFPLGGGAYIPQRPKKTRDEVLVYAAGPLANVLLALLALPVLLARPEGELFLRYYLQLSGNLVVRPSFVEQLLGLTIAVNLILAVGNLLPAYPLDGGRILRALLRPSLGQRRATVVITVLGWVIGAALGWLGYTIGDPLLLLGAGFVIVLSVLEYRNGWQRRRLAARSLQTVLRVPEHEHRTYPTESVAAVRQRFRKTGWPVLPVFNGWNQLAGFVEKSVLQEEPSSAEEAALPYCELEFTTAGPAEDLLAVTERIVAANVYGAVVYGARGRIVGYVFTEDVMPLLDTPWRRLRRRLDA